MPTGPGSDHASTGVFAVSTSVRPPPGRAIPAIAPDTPNGRTTNRAGAGGGGAGELVARGFCHGCVPLGPVSEVVCAYCGDGPLLAGSLAGVDPVADPAVAAWLTAEGWALHPAATCPACRRAFGRASSS